MCKKKARDWMNLVNKTGSPRCMIKWTFIGSWCEFSYRRLSETCTESEKKIRTENQPNAVCVNAFAKRVFVWSQTRETAVPFGRIWEAKKKNQMCAHTHRLNCFNKAELIRLHSLLIRGSVIRESKHLHLDYDCNNCCGCCRLHWLII